jgi:hypothetical protein
MSDPAEPHGFRRILGIGRTSAGGASSDPEQLRAWARSGAVVLGTGCTAAGAIAVFVTNNGAGAAALLIAGFAFALMALTGRSVLVKFPGGGEVSAAARTGAKVETAADLAMAGHPEAAAQVLDNAMADSLRRAGAEDPEATAKTVRGWPELKDLVNRLRDALDSAGIEYKTISGKDVPRLRATVNNTDYGLYAMPGSDIQEWWVGSALAGTRKLPGDVRPVLVTENPPGAPVLKAAKAAGVAVMWLDADGTLHDAPW